ncbi:MAG: NADH-ubiquinone oxidoreductase-F iron-sulfur binding region domain-containing protein [Gammaproteobacteria bacterium]|nr:NADH-ubiquinone oxidoreductase-F iron-sulfur binding region domain-containing protein [Gammaproteobacteria bacterium]
MSTENSSVAEEQLVKYRREPGMVLQMLRGIQLAQNFIGPGDIETLARSLNLPTTKIRALIDFYSFLHDQPRGRYAVYFSDSITDHMLGSRERAQQLCRALGVQLGKPDEKGLVTVALTSCTGLCERGPAVLVNGIAIDRIDEQRVTEMAGLIRQQVPLGDWPLEWFVINDALRRKGPLLDNDLRKGEAIERAIEIGSQQVIAELQASGLRGCGGAGFPTWRKWDICRGTSTEQRYVVCNADEGEPGTFKDRALLNTYSRHVFDGMTVCGVTVGASKGFIYLRHEYEFLREQLERRLQRRREINLLGRNILGHHGINFDIEIIMGAGAYVCGEESALIESMEGKRGIPRIRPPFPVTHGYNGRPTVVNNVETFAYATGIVARGPGFVAHDGEDPCWKLLSIAGDCRSPGIYEIPLGTSIRDVCEMCGADDVQAIQVGGPGGILISADELDRKVSFDDLNTAGSFIIFDSSRDMLEVALNFTHFFKHESCGFCTPCRVGTKLMQAMVDKIANGHGARVDIEQMQRLHHLMTRASHCGLGQRAAVPILTTYEKFPDSINDRVGDVDFKPAFDVEAAIERSKQIVAEETRS